MPAYAATLKPLPVTFFPITSSSDMYDALAAASGLGMHGTITVPAFEEGASAVWKMEVVDLHQHAVPAVIGDVFVWNGIDLIVVPQAEFDARYDVTP